MGSDACSSGHFDFDIPEDQELESNAISEAASDIRVVTNKLHGDGQQQLFLQRFLDKVHND